MTCEPFCSQCGGHLGHPSNGDELCQKCKDKNMKDPSKMLELAGRLERMVADPGWRVFYMAKVEAEICAAALHAKAAAQ